MKITKNSIIADVIREHRNVSKVLKKYNLNCAACRGAEEESIEKISYNYGIDLTVFLSEIQKAAL